MSLRLNPLYEKLLPQMSEEEFAELKASIQDEGQHYPIIVNEDLRFLMGTIASAPAQNWILNPILHSVNLTIKYVRKNL
jgi:hypothetical protein